MTTRPRLVRSVPFWVLIVGSIATSAFGAWLTLDKLGVMTSALAAGTATGVEVYVGQTWAIVGGILIATGLVGLALALVLGVARTFVAQPAIEVVEVFESEIDDDAEDVAEVEHDADTSVFTDTADVADALETADVDVPAEPELTKAPAAADRP